MNSTLLFVLVVFGVAVLLVYVFGSFIMLITGNGDKFFTWPYHLFKKQNEDRPTQ